MFLKEGGREEGWKEGSKRGRQKERGPETGLLLLVRHLVFEKKEEGREGRK